jgi:hypothetical protein
MQYFVPLVCLCNWPSRNICMRNLVDGSDLSGCIEIRVASIGANLSRSSDEFCCLTHCPEWSTALASDRLVSYELNVIIVLFKACSPVPYAQWA